MQRGPYSFSRRHFIRSALCCASALSLTPFFSGTSLAQESAASASEQHSADLAEFAARLAYHTENKNELRLVPLQARDRRGSIPNNNRPAQKRTPDTKLPPNPEAEKGVIRRVSLSSDEKVCALTFDFCELATLTTGFDADMVIWMQDNNIPATFFMGGKWMRTHDRRVREVLRDPLFEIGNHAWTHANFALLSREAMQEQILDTAGQYELLRDQAGKEASRSALGDLPIQQSMRLFRFPYGRCNKEALELLAELGFEPVQWDVVGDSGGNNGTLERGKKIADKVTPGSIVLFHGNLVPKGTFQLLRYVTGILQRRGYRFVTVSELLAMGRPERTQDGYFEKPGDNLSLDNRFGHDGTGK